MVICSNRGPTIACSLGFWLRLHVPFLFGACIARIFSPSSTLSTFTTSDSPAELLGVSFVFDMVAAAFAGEGSFAATSFNWVLYCLPIARTRGDPLRRAVRGSIARNSQWKSVLKWETVLSEWTFRSPVVGVDGKRYLHPPLNDLPSSAFWG
jgi:hypothetical protein